MILTPQRSTKNQLKSSMQAFARSPAIVRLVGNDKLMQLLLRAGVAALDEESALKSSMHAFARSPAIVRFNGNNELKQLLLRAGEKRDCNTGECPDGERARKVGRRKTVVFRPSS